MNTLKRDLSGLAMSILELVIGIMLLLDPVSFTTGIIVVFGVVLMLCGLWNVIKYFRTSPEEAIVGQLLVKGLIELLAGAFCAFNSGWFIVTFPVLTLVYGVVILVTAMTKIQWMVDLIRLKRKRWFLAAFSAAISLICGITIISNPFATTAVLWMFTGISLIVEAVFDMITMFFGNKTAKKEPAEQEEI